MNKAFKSLLDIGSLARIKNGRCSCSQPHMRSLGYALFVGFIGRRASYMTVDMTIFSLNADLGNVASSSILSFHTWPVPKGASYYTHR